MKENMIAVAQIQDMVAYLQWRIDSMIFPPTSTSTSDPEHGNNQHRCHTFHQTF